MAMAKTLMRLTAVAAIPFLLSGCWTLSMNPLYTEDSLVAHDALDPNLAGVWGNPEKPDAETWQFIEADGNSYRLIIREKEQSLLVNPEVDGVFEAHLLRLGDHMFLDVYPEEPPSVNEFYKAHVIPMHSFMKVKLEGHVLTLSDFDAEWLEEGIEQGTIDIRHERRDEMIVLTASTRDLQALILAHADTAFTRSDVVYRLQ